MFQMVTMCIRYDSGYVCKNKIYILRVAIAAASPDLLLQSYVFYILLRPPSFPENPSYSMLYAILKSCY